MRSACVVRTRFILNNFSGIELGGSRIPHWLRPWQRWHSRPYPSRSWYSIKQPWVDPVGWLHTRPTTVTHQGTNRARRWLTSVYATNAANHYATPPTNKRCLSYLELTLVVSFAQLVKHCVGEHGEGYPFSIWLEGLGSMEPGLKTDLQPWPWNMVLTHWCLEKW